MHIGPGRSGGRPRLWGPTDLLLSVALYGVLAIMVFAPMLVHAQGLGFLPAIASVVGAAGTFILSRRWIAAWPASFLAGAVYGFGPFALGFLRFHPAASLVPAWVPWLFCLAAFRHGRRRGSLRDGLYAGTLAILPFGFIIAFFQCCAAMRFWPVPADPFGAQTWAGLLVPQAVPGVGVYHVPLVLLVVGLAVHALARRAGPLVVVAVALVLAMSPPVLQVSPVAWLAIPTLYAAVLAGVGAQTLAWAGRADGGVLGLALGAAGVLAAMTVVLGLRFAPSAVYFDAARLYGRAAVMSAAILFVAWSGARWHGLRWAILVAALGLDLILGARLLVSQMR